MPRYSCFTRYGLLQYSSEPSDGEKIYKSMLAAYTDPKTGQPVFDLSVGTDLEARIYATAMAIAAARATVQRADNQNTPTRSYDKLADWEEAFRLAPGATDTLKQRRDALGLREKLARGARREAILDGLQQILGANLIAYRALKGFESTKWPTDPSVGPGVFGRAALPAKVVRILDPIATLGSSITVAYENWNTSFPAVQIVQGDVLCVQPENLGLAEKVTVASSSGTGSSRTLTATFANAHDQGASATTGPAPIWWSTKRIVFIIVKALAAIDPKLRRRVDEYMARVARTVTQWAIIQPTSPGARTCGPFTLDISPLGAVPIGTLSIEPPGPFSVSSISPNSGPAAGGNTVTAYGTGFLAFLELPHAVTVLGNGAATSVTIVDDTTMTFVMPAHGAGLAFLQITIGGTTFTVPYTYV